MSDHAHRGARETGPASEFFDRTTLELDEAVRNAENATGAHDLVGFAKDPGRVKRLAHDNLGSDAFLFGTIIHPLPQANWYKVQLGSAAGTVSAVMAMPGNATPIGPREVGMAGPNDQVVVIKPRGAPYHIILCVIPPHVADANVSSPDWVVQAGGSGRKMEEMHLHPSAAMYREGGVIDWSANRPTDQTYLERGWSSPLGAAFTVDDFLIQARMGEQCGLWMTWHDNWVRLAGVQLLIESSVHELDAGDDEGESRYFRGVAAYPWEALGLYAPQTGFTTAFDAKRVQYEGGRASVDLPEGGEDLTPVYRYQEYAGYLGQGYFRAVVLPARQTGKSQASDADSPAALWRETVGLDGDYCMVSAKGVHVGKRLKIPVPVKIRDQQARDGDDAERGGYKFSGLFGTGSDHKVGDVGLPAGPGSVVRAISVMDLTAHTVNWKAVHPFHYHAGDYRLPQQSDASPFTKSQEKLDLANPGFLLPDPEPVEVVVDHRYGPVKFYERESFWKIHDDGTVQIVGPCGEEIVMGGGRIRLSAPLGIDVCPGTDFNVLAGQVTVRAKGSVDLSSSAKDVRLKAEGNMQLLAGNGGTGGVLIESKGGDAGQDYAGKFGEDVVSSGVVLKAASGPVAAVSKDMYLRTDGGDILLDASRGRNACQIYARDFHAYASEAVSFAFGPAGEDSTVRRVYNFGETTASFDVKLRLGGELVSYSGGGGTPGITVDGKVNATGSVSSGGTLSSRNGGTPSKVPTEFTDGVRQKTSTAQSGATALAAEAKQTHKTSVVEKYYQAGGFTDENLARIGFSFRDPPVGASQYGATGFTWSESRWQTMARTGGGISGRPWTETPVVYQGQPTYPWPGKANWVDGGTMLRPAAQPMYDAQAGIDRDRPGPYEEATIPPPTALPPNGNHTLNV